MHRKLGTTAALAALFVSLLAMPTAGASASASRLATTAATPTRQTQQIVLTNSSGTTPVLAIKGDKIVVELSNNDGGLRWSTAELEPSSSASPAAPTLVLKSATTWPKGASRTVFRVTNYGTAHLEVTGDPICSAAQVCPQYVIVWTATVVVPVVDPPGPSAP